MFFKGALQEKALSFSDICYSDEIIEYDLSPSAFSKLIELMNHRTH